MDILEGRNKKDDGQLNQGPPALSNTQKLNCAAVTTAFTPALFGGTQPALRAGESLGGRAVSN